MTKNEFISLLSKNLRRFPKAEINKSIDFYSELIDDKIEDGMSEQEAVKSLGEPSEIARKIIESSPFSALYTTAKIDVDSTLNERLNGSRKSKMPTWLIVFLSITAIVWAPIAFAVIITIWAVGLAFVVSAVAVILSGFAVLIFTPLMFVNLGGVGGTMAIGISLVCVGLGILFFIGVKYLFKGIYYSTKYIFRSLVRAFKNGGNN